MVTFTVQKYTRGNKLSQDYIITKKFLSNLAINKNYMESENKTKRIPLLS